MITQIAWGFGKTCEIIRSIRYSKELDHVVEFSNFALGILGFHNIIYSSFFEDRKIFEIDDETPLWQQRMWKTCDFLGNFSLVLSGIRSQPAVDIWKWSAQRIFSAQQLERFLGKQSCTFREQLHAKIGLLSFLFGIPVTLKTMYYFYCWTRKPKEEMMIHHDWVLKTHPVPFRKTDAMITVEAALKTAKKLISTPRLFRPLA